MLHFLKKNVAFLKEFWLKRVVRKSYYHLRSQDGLKFRILPSLNEKTLKIDKIWLQFSRNEVFLSFLGSNWSQLAMPERKT
jgi:hypothetical protein